MRRFLGHLHEFIWGAAALACGLNLFMFVFGPFVHSVTKLISEARWPGLTACEIWHLTFLTHRPAPPCSLSSGLKGVDLVVNYWLNEMGGITAWFILLVVLGTFSLWRCTDVGEQLARRGLK